MLTAECALGMVHYGTSPDDFAPEDIPTCHGGIHYLHVDVTGEIFPCANLQYPPFRVGTLADELAPLWEDSPVLQEIRRFHRQLQGGCGSCPSRDICGGCRGLAYYDTGQLLHADPDCPFAQ